MIDKEPTSWSLLALQWQIGYKICLKISHISKNRIISWPSNSTPRPNPQHQTSPSPTYEHKIAFNSSKNYNSGTRSSWAKNHQLSKYGPQNAVEEVEEMREVGGCSS